MLFWRESASTLCLHAVFWAWLLSAGIADSDASRVADAMVKCSLGHTAVLPCNASTSTPVIWSRYDNTMLTHFNEINAVDGTIINGFAARFSLLNSSASRYKHDLQIADCMASDAGLYACEEMQGQGQIKHLVILTVNTSQTIIADSILAIDSPVNATTAAAPPRKVSDDIRSLFFFLVLLGIVFLVMVIVMVVLAVKVCRANAQQPDKGEENNAAESDAMISTPPA